jgi:glutaredoxin-like protein NrdH
MAADIMLYALSTCIHCKKTKELLDDKGADYDFLYVDKLQGKEREDAISEVKEYNKSLSFPTVVFRNQDDKVVVGFKEQELKEALGE